MTAVGVVDVEDEYEMKLGRVARAQLEGSGRWVPLASGAARVSAILLSLLTESMSEIGMPQGQMLAAGTVSMWTAMSVARAVAHAVAVVVVPVDCTAVLARARTVAPVDPVAHQRHQPAPGSVAAVGIGLFAYPFGRLQALRFAECPSAPPAAKPAILPTGSGSSDHALSSGRSSAAGLGELKELPRDIACHLGCHLFSSCVREL